MRLQLVGVTAMVSVMAAYGPVAAAEDPPVFRLTLRNHVFDPARITVPANKRLVLIVRNGDDTPAEFESTALGVEKIISAGREATIRLGPLTPGEYSFIDEFHQDLAHGVLIAAAERAVLAAALIVFREVFEAGLIVGIVLSATQGVRGRGAWIAGGIGGGVAGAAVVALFAGAIGDALDGAGQEVLNGAILLAAAVMLGWHTVWMARHGRELAAEMKALGKSVASGGKTLFALAIVVGAAVLREGAEVVLFLYGLVAGGDGFVALVAGGTAGVLGGAAASWLLYRGLVAIPTRRLFGVTNALLMFLAAGMAAQGAGFLIQADMAPALGRRLWDTSWLLDEKSLVGRTLHALVGYTDRPAGLQVLVYAGVLLVLVVGTRAASRTGPAPAPPLSRV